MKGGKDEEKRLDPLFPRLHINDVEKGGPRPPPRNKMALCERLSIPSSQKFTPNSASMLPLPPINSSNLATSASLSHGDIHKKCLLSLSPFSNSPDSPHFVERLHSYSSSGLNMKTKLTDVHWHSIESINNLTLNAMGCLTPRAEHSMFQNSSVKELRAGVNYRIPTSTQSVQTSNCCTGQQKMDEEKLTCSCPNSSGKLEKACEKHLKPTLAADQTEENTKAYQSDQNCTEKPCPSLANGEKMSADALPSLLATGRIFEPNNQARVSFNAINTKKRSRLLEDLSRLCDLNAQSPQGHRDFQGSTLKNGVPAEPNNALRETGASTLDVQSHSTPSPENNPATLKRLEMVNHSQAGDMDRNVEVTDNSVVDSISGLAISSDDVVDMIGQVQFWKARRTIVHQQRVFAMQVFELHRLIKVQGLIARSPELLFEDLVVGKPSMSVSPVKKLWAENLLEPPISKAGSQKQNLSIKCSAENAVRKPAFPCVNNDTNKGLITQQSSDKFYSGNQPPASTATNAKPALWCFPSPPGNQWLIPVKSTSEGLVSMSYTAPCPPGFTAPIYCRSGPLSLSPGCGDFLNPTYGFPASHQQGVGIDYRMPVMNRSLAIPSPYQSSSNNISAKRSGMLSGCVSSVENLQTSNKESDLQGSTASSPLQGGALPLFPTKPAAVKAPDEPIQRPQTHGTRQKVQVIKVRPHNPISASESAARIFRSIQEERKQND